MARSPKQSRAVANIPTYETVAFLPETGEPVKVNVPINIPQNHSTPRENDQGIVPEFVNISGTVYQLCPPVGQPGETIVVPPFGIVRGEQHRDKSEPSKAWGVYPPFKERMPNKDGEFDDEYLFSAKEVIKETSQIKHPEMGRKRLRMWAAYGKVQTFDEKGLPERTAKELEEDRSEVKSFILGRADELQIKWDEQFAAMTGTRKKMAITPGSPAS